MMTLTKLAENTMCYIVKYTYIILQVGYISKIVFA